MTRKYFGAVGGRIRELRDEAGLSQQALADAAGLNQRYVSRMELGLQNITIAVLGKTALALKVPLARFFDGIEPDVELLRRKPRSNARVVKIPGPPETS